MTTQRPPSQLELDLPIPGRGEASRRDAREVEVITAVPEPESPACGEDLMEAICDPDNVEAALCSVVRNKGAPGVDGITVRQLPDSLKTHWPEIENQLLQGCYQPQPVRRVQIPKPTGGMRDLGIPTAIDRVIQQAVLQRLQPLWDSQHSVSIVTAFDRIVLLTKRWRRRKLMSPRAIGSLSIWIWRSFSTGLITTD